MQGRAFESLAQCAALACIDIYAQAWQESTLSLVSVLESHSLVELAARLCRGLLDVGTVSAAAEIVALVGETGSNVLERLIDRLVHRRNYAL